MSSNTLSYFAIHARLCLCFLLAGVLLAGCPPAKPDVNQNDAVVLCGDQLAQGLEECDGADLKGATCADLGLPGGELSCTTACTFDTSQCTGCGNGICEPEEDRVGCPDDCGARKVSANTASCAVMGDGSAFCWGNGVAGNLGSGYFEQINPPAPVLGGSIFDSIGMGVEHTCAVLLGGGVSCFGKSYYLGSVTTEDSATPIPVSGLPTMVAVSSASEGSCALEDLGDLFCWGGTLATTVPGGSLTPVLVPMPGTATEQVACGAFHCCVLVVGNEVYCWGNNQNGALGYDLQEERLDPVQVTLGYQIRQLSAGVFHNCILSEAGEVVCWGDNHGGQCGLPASAVPVLPPAQVTLPEPAVKVSAGGHHTCAIGASGEAWCWGGEVYNDYWGQLGHGEDSGSYAPVKVLDLSGVVDIAAGYKHTCAVTGDGRVWCWGSNFSGEVDAASAPYHWIQPGEVVIPQSQ